MGNELIKHVSRLHTTEMGKERIRRNCSLVDADVVQWCRSGILDETAHMIRKGKNWYVQVNGCIITVHAGSYTIITAHRVNE